MNLEDKLKEMTKEPIEGRLLDFGYVTPVLEPTTYVLGGITKAPQVIVNETGDWHKSYPPFESQLRHNFDSHGCTTYALHNAIEMNLRHVFGVSFDASERYAYNIANITPPGADPLKVIDVIHKNFCIPEKDLPVTETLAEFMTPRPMSQELLDFGKQFPYDIWFEVLWIGKISRQERINRLKDGSKKGTIVLAVTAWFKDTNTGRYIDNGLRNTHLTTFGALLEDGIEIFDSYETDGKPTKTLDLDHDIEFAMRITCTPKTISEQITWLQRLLNALKEALWLIASNKPTPETVSEPVAPVVPTVSEEGFISTLERFCIAIRTHEGWYKGSRSWRNNNPGNVRYSSVGYAPIYGTVSEDRAGVPPGQRGFAMFKDHDTGMLYLQNYVRSIITGKSGSFNVQAKKMFNIDPDNMGDLTLHQFFQIYAPVTDNNKPLAYATQIARALDVGIGYQVKLLVV